MEILQGVVSLILFISSVIVIVGEITE